MADRDVDLIQGTLNVLVLKTLSWGPMNGYAIAQWVRQITDGDIELEEGALYPALHRMEHRGWIEAEWGISENNRRAKFYRHTAAGRARFRAEAPAWHRYADAIAAALRATSPDAVGA